MTACDPRAAESYWMPAEWHRHAATWLSFPTNRETWPAGLEEVEEAYFRILDALLPVERVELLVDDEETAGRVRTQVERRGAPAANLRTLIIPTADVWMRDYGPTFVLAKESGLPPLAMIHWRFNAWGDKYADLKEDARVPALLEPLLDVPRFEPGLVLEGGSIEVNGAGICMTTEQCLLHPNRNPGCSRAELESALRRHLGVSSILWLGEGIEGDDTDGHIDDIARFTGPDTVVCVVEDDPSSANYAPLRDNLARLGGARTPAGASLRVVELPMPQPVTIDGSPLPASYANFYIANRVVLVPTFADPADQTALSVLGDLFPDRRIVGIDCRRLVEGLGALHCITQQQPLGNRQSVVSSQ